MENPEILERPYNRLVEHTQEIHRDQRGKFTGPGRGQPAVLSFPVRNADRNRNPQNEISASSTPERSTPREPDMDISPVKQQVEEPQHTGDNGSLGTPPALDISALSDNPGDISQESGEV